METISKSQVTYLKPILFGLIFGFLLQKGGVGKYNVLMGSLLLQDFTVWKVILTAILVGMLGLHLLKKKSLITSKVKPTRIGANIIGGLTFGAGFGLMGYCPGTGAAALGQGNLDALGGIIGLVVGSMVYAEASGFLSKTVEKWGTKGKITIGDVFHATEEKAVLGMSLGIGLALVILETAFRR